MFYSMGLCFIFKRNSVEFLVDVLDFLWIIMLICRTIVICFSNGFWYRCMSYGSWKVFRKIESHSSTHDGCHLFYLRIGTWEFYWYLSWRFSKYSFRFCKSLIDIGCRSYELYYMTLILNNYLLLVDVMPLRSGRDRPRRIPVDKEAASAPYAPLPQGEPQAPLEFQSPPMP